MQSKSGAAWGSPAKVPTSSKKTIIAVKCSTEIFKKNLRARFAKETSASYFNKKRQAAANRFKPNSLAHTGCALFANLERFHLKEQQRSDDPENNELVKKLSNGQTVQLSDIMRYMHLSKNDIQNHPDEWKYAPILVSTNAECLNIGLLNIKNLSLNGAPE